MLSVCDSVRLGVEIVLFYEANMTCSDVADEVMQNCHGVSWEHL